MDKESISKNLIRLRNSLKLNQEDFAEKLEIPISTYRNIELANSLPSIITLKKIADKFNMDINIFLQPVKELKFVRFRADKNMKKREHTLSLISFWLNDYNRLENLLDDKKNYTFNNFNFVNVDNLNPVEIAKETRIKLELNEDEPIKDICGLLEKNGIKIYNKEFKSIDNFFGLSIACEDGGPAIIVNTWDRISLERRIFSVAHELGHLLLHLNSYNVTEWEENENEEKEANEFASYFLMPKLAFENEWNKNTNLDFVDKVLKIKTIFKVSYQVVLYRLKEYFPDKNIWALFYSQYKYKTGKSLTKTEEPKLLQKRGEPEGTEIDSLPKNFFFNSRLETLVGNALDHSKISQQEAAFILERNLSEIKEFYENFKIQKFLLSL